MLQCLPEYLPRLPRRQASQQPLSGPTVLGSAKGRSNKDAQFKHLLFKHLQKVYHTQTSTTEREEGFKFKPIHLPRGPREQEHHIVSRPQRAAGVVPHGGQRAWLAGQTRRIWWLATKNTVD